MNPALKIKANGATRLALKSSHDGERGVAGPRSKSDGGRLQSLPRVIKPCHDTA
jgi:hypothetical protein